MIIRTTTTTVYHPIAKRRTYYTLRTRADPDQWINIAAELSIHLNCLLRILFLVALFRPRAFLLYLSKRFRHVFDLIPNVKTYVDRRAAESPSRYSRWVVHLFR